MSESTDSGDAAVKAIATLIIGCFAILFVSLIVLFLLPLYRLFKHNKVMKIYGPVLIFIGLVLLYGPFSSWIFTNLLELVYQGLISWLGEKSAYKLAPLVFNGLKFQLKVLPTIFIPTGIVCLVKGIIWDQEEPKKISNVKQRPTSLKKLKKEYRANLDYLQYDKNTSVYLGRNRIKKNKIFLDEREGHLLCVGATRSGKTSRVLFPIMLHDFLSGKAALNIDPKGSLNDLIGTYKVIKQFKMEHKFKVIMLDNPEISCPYNPVARGNVSQIANRIMKLSEWTEPFYRNQCYQNLLKYLQKMKGSKDGLVWEETPTLDKIYQIFERENNNNTGSMVANLCDFHYADFAPIFNIDTSGIDFLEAQKNGEFVYIIVNTDTYLDASKMFIRALLMDLMWCANQVQSGKAIPKPFSIHIDELSDFIHPGLGFESFMKKCASAGYSLHCYSQSFGDLRDKGLEDMIISNTYNHMILRQSYPENADLAAKMFGSFDSEFESIQTENDEKTGFKTLFKGQELKVDPNLIKNLESGSAIFHNRTSLELMDLSVPPFYSLSGEEPFIEEDEKSKLLNELKSRAFAAKKCLKTSTFVFEPIKYLNNKKSALKDKSF